MAKEASFDIVSKADMNEVQNAVNMVAKEIEQRFDLKGTGSSIDLGKDGITLNAPDETKLRNILDVLHDKMTRRQISLKCLDAGKVEASLGGKVRQQLGIRQGIDRDHARKLVDLIKGTKLKVQTQIQDDQVRVLGKSKDDLQAVIKALRAGDFPLDLQFLNFRD
ncbi:MAG: YajQ family cyclic di-GMP-binding protein [Candidatus Sericytochromatia bacterium]|nr:YajQ family cyclic di-GMP-binding protein [Candidatus Sericytochromatia bacterium]